MSQVPWFYVHLVHVAVGNVLLLLLLFSVVDLSHYISSVSFTPESPRQACFRVVCDAHFLSSFSLTLLAFAPVFCFFYSNISREVCL
jgi:hypothetical protein